jgi:hypothetical protein
VFCPFNWYKRWIVTLWKYETEYTKIDNLNGLTKGANNIKFIDCTSLVKSEEAFQRLSYNIITITIQLEKSWDTLVYHEYIIFESFMQLMGMHISSMANSGHT